MSAVATPATEKAADFLSKAEGELLALAYLFDSSLPHGHDPDHANFAKLGSIGVEAAGRHVDRALLELGHMSGFFLEEEFMQTARARLDGLDANAVQEGNLRQVLFVLEESMEDLIALRSLSCDAFAAESTSAGAYARLALASVAAIGRNVDSALALLGQPAGYFSDRTVELVGTAVSGSDTP